MLAPFSGPWLVGTTKVYPGPGADIVMESITRFDASERIRSPRTSPGAATLAFCHADTRAIAANCPDVPWDGRRTRWTGRGSPEAIRYLFALCNGVLCAAWASGKGSAIGMVALWSARLAQSWAGSHARAMGTPKWRDARVRPFASPYILREPSALI